jgi:hypothetical protein
MGDTYIVSGFLGFVVLRISKAPLQTLAPCIQGVLGWACGVALGYYFQHDRLQERLVGVLCVLFLMLSFGSLAVTYRLKREFILMIEKGMLRPTPKWENWKKW